MKWDLHIRFDISRGRHKLFSLSRFPGIKQLTQRHQKMVIQCYKKNRYVNKQHALNCGWTNHMGTKYDAYACPVCEGWHLTTVR